jgi:hypothetical protein
MVWRRPFARRSSIVERTLQVHEANLGRRHGKPTQRAGRTRPMFKRHGTVGALTRLVMRSKPSSGLLSMAEAGRLDICFEQLVIDHSDLFLPQAVAMARANLAKVKGEPPPQVPRRRAGSSKRRDGF